MLKPIVPMEPVRRNDIPEGEQWIAQIKWDGVRVLSYFDGQEVKLYNRACRERTLHYPEITSLNLFQNVESVILDGEVIALGPDGKPSFHEVMRRDGIRRLDRVRSVQKSVPITYMVFDLLYLNGFWITERPLSERLDLLSSVIEPNHTVQVVKVEEDGHRLFEVMRQFGMEGIVMKQKHSPYLIGQKKDTWVKVKNYQDVIAVIGGFTLDDSGIVAAVLVGLYDEQEQLWYIGHVGTGRLTHQGWKSLTECLLPLVSHERPFVNQPERHRDVTWVHPMVTAKITYLEWRTGRSLRQPSFQGITDVPAKACVMPSVRRD
jgi:bifunctional non-homologous end joining protein LigD